MSKQYGWDNINNVVTNNSTFHYFRCTKADWYRFTDVGFIRMKSTKRIINIDFYNKTLISYYSTGTTIKENLFTDSDHTYGDDNELFKIIDFKIENPNIMNKWLFYVTNESGGGGSTITGDLIISHINSDYIYLEKKQIRPTDHSQEWVDTDETREDPDRPPEIGSCKCTDEFQWIKDGTMCDGTNLCEREKYQVKSNCSSNWVDYSPTVYRLGNVIKYDSEECGTMEYKEEWSGPFCGSYINENYPNSDFSLYDEDKYNILLPYIKYKNETEWRELDCKNYITFKLIKSNSFECGWSTTRSETVYDDNLCGSVVKTKYPSLASKVTDENKYKIYYHRKHTTLPYPQNNDNMTEDQWLWGDWEYYNYGISRNYGRDCECGYREYGYKIDDTVGYEYVCGDDINKDSGYMYYKRYKYKQCEDGSNFEWIKSEIDYVKASHSSSYECVYDPETNANTTKQTYRTFYNENTKAYEAVLCPNKIIISTSKKSYDCGWATQWIKVGEICCGELERTGATPTFTITRVEGNWIKQGNKFTSNKINKNETTIEKIYFKGNGFIRIDYDQSSENSYDYAYIYKIDSESSINTNLRYETTGSTYIAISQNDNEEHFIKVSYQKDYSGDEGRDNVILTFSPSYAKPNCEMYGKYNKEKYQYTTDGGKTWNSFSPLEFRYGSQIEYQSEDCGFIPKLTQWKLICPDITYETAQVGDGCVICDKYNNAPTMFAIEKKQYSEDGGHTWIDAEPLEGNNIRTEKVLKWKAPKCGYTGDTFETRYTNEVCENGDLYGDSARWVSSDNGQTWIKIEGSEKYHVLMEKNSNKCEQPPTT